MPSNRARDFEKFSAQIGLINSTAWAVAVM